MQSAFSYPPVSTQAIASGCYITSIGCLHHPVGLKYPSQSHPEHFYFEWDKGRTIADTTLVIIARGAGEWASRDASGHLEAGDALYIPSREWHRYRPMADTGWSESWLCMRGTNIHQLRRAELIDTEIKVLKCDTATQSQLARLHSDVLREPGINNPSWGARGLAILLELTERGTMRRTPPVESLARAVTYICENSHLPISVNNVAEACGKSRRSMERMFAAGALGTVADMITRERMDRARALLRSTRLSVKEVAADSGFQSTQHLISNFKRIEHCTPSKFRARAAS